MVVWRRPNKPHNSFVSQFVYFTLIKLALLVGTIMIFPAGIDCAIVGAKERWGVKRQQFLLEWFAKKLLKCFFDE